MSQILTKFRNWLQSQSEDFDENEIPSPAKAAKILHIVTNYFSTMLTNYIGMGDNGIVFQTDDNCIIKFTIDASEAHLWTQLEKIQRKGIAQIVKIIQLISSNLGETIIYVLKAKYIPHDLTNEQKDAIIKAMRTVRHKLKDYKVTDESQYYKKRTLEIVKEFDKLAQKDPRFENVVNLLMDLADKENAHLYDLQPENFKVDADGMVTLVDPSVPDLTNVKLTPKPLLFEHKLELLNLKSISY